MLLNIRKKSKLEVGDQAPDFTLTTQDGSSVRLSDFEGKKNIVIYFYPKDNTKYCIIESMTFRDRISQFKEENAEILGISSDGPESHVQFAKEYKLPYLLLSDTQNAVRKLYKVPATFGMIPGRVTYVIDKAGVIQNIFSSPFDPKSHVTQALNTLRSLR